MYCFLLTSSHTCTYAVADAVQKLLPPICSPQQQHGFEAVGQRHGDEQDDDTFSEGIHPATGGTEEEEEEEQGEEF